MAAHATSSAQARSGGRSSGKFICYALLAALSQSLFESRLLLDILDRTKPDRIASQQLANARFASAWRMIKRVRSTDLMHANVEPVKVAVVPFTFKDNLISLWRKQIINCFPVVINHPRRARSIRPVSPFRKWQAALPGPSRLRVAKMKPATRPS